MSYIIDLPPLIEARIEAEAQKAGVSPADLLANVVCKTFGMTADAEEQTHVNAPSIALLSGWLAEAAKPCTALDIAAAEHDMEELMQNLNRPRREAGERLHFPPEKTGIWGV